LKQTDQPPISTKPLADGAGHTFSTRFVETGQADGRQSYAERSPEVVALAKKLARYPVKRKRSLREVAAELEAQGHWTKAGKRYAVTRGGAGEIARNSAPLC
jgi:hypothetical protein